MHQALKFGCGRISVTGTPIFDPNSGLLLIVNGLGETFQVNTKSCQEPLTGKDFYIQDGDREKHWYVLEEDEHGVLTCCLYWHRNRQRVRAGKTLVTRPLSLFTRDQVKAA